MLLPSDVARLVLGYLQQEKLLATCQAFILESSDLKEYAEHCTGEGFVPACLLSLFGKNLITILNEYVTLKSKEAPNDVPAMMSSLWKKLDYTLAQIRIMQMSSGFAAHQRSRTRSAIADMKKQKCLHQSSSSNLGMSSVTHQQGQLNSIPMTATQVVLKPVITPSPAHIRLLGSSSAHQGEIQENHVGENSLNLVSTFQERKLHSSVMSPGKRKSDSQKKKNIGSSGPQSSNSDLQDSLTAEEESSPMEEENEQLEFIDGDLPQMIIENAREKILSNKCLQEKLAENINKFLGSDGNISQAAKQAESGPTIQESSIDEFLDLQQSEIHMTEEAIQEILEKTESDPAFQGLYDIFDFGKTKGNRNAPHGISTQEGGIENAILVDEENLEALESYIATKELGDNSQGCLPYTDDSKETCILKTDCNGSDGTMAEHLKMQVVATGEFPGGSKETSDSDSVETPECKNTLESGESQFTHPEFTGGHNVGTYNQQGTAIRDCEMEKDLLCQDVQPLPDLQYDHLVAPQTSLAGSAECCSVPNNILSEKTNAKLLTPPRTGDSEIMKGYIVSPIRSAESEKNLEQITKQSMMIPEPGPQNQNSPPLSHGQSQEKLESDSSTALGNTSDPNSVEVQLGVVDTSNSLRSDDLPDHQESCSEHQTQNLEDSGIAQVDMQEPSSSTKADADSMVLASDSEMHTELATENSSTSPTVSHSPAPVGESSPGNKVAATVSSSSQATNVDPSSIVSLKIIISDDPFISSDTELNSAVSSITGENMPTIILSSPGQSPAKMTRPSNCRTSEESEKIGDAALMEQNLLVLRPQDSVASTLNVQNEECAVFSISEASNVAKDGGFIQLMPATTASFNNSNNVYIATCVTEPTALSTNVTSSNLVVLPGSSTALASQVPTPQQLRTPPRTNNLFTMNPPMSPNFPQGSAIIITSPVQPVLQGMVGMIPVSIMGQSGNTFSDPSPQILHLPIQASLGRGSVPKLPLPPKSQRIPRNKSNTGRMVLSGSESVNCPGSQVQRIGNSDKSTCGDVKKKLEVVAGDTTSSISKQSESHRRVLCFDKGLATPVDNTHVSQKERKENALVPGNSPNTVLSSAKIQSSKRERERTLPRILCKPDITNRSSAVKEIQSERKSSGPGLASDVLRKQTANKENELERTVDRTPQNQEVATLPSSQQNISLHNEKNSSLSQELTKKQGLQSNTNSKNSGVLPSKEPKKDQGKSPNQSHSLTSPLTKQAMEIFHDIQRQSPASKQPESVDLPVPRTPSGMGDRHSDDSFDIVRTPTCRRYSEDSTTPRIMVPPATPDLPACSPASETSSENSVSMAAHTLMILSRAAIARTSAATPLKDNTQQLKSLRSAAKKRKQEDLVECEKNSRTANKKDLQNFTVPMKKKKVKKKLPIAFPAGMDVDKFLLSLHYDE